jgi:glucokinase
MGSFAIGVDLGGTNLRVAAVTPEGQRLKTISLPTRLAAGTAAVLDDMAGAISEIAGKLREEPIGIGVGSPGPLELPAGVLHHPPNLPGFDGLNLRTELERRVGYPVQVDSDANLAALGEALLGAGNAFGVDSLMMYTLGTGVGAGIVLEGHVWRGMQGAAGEMGHGPLLPDGPACGCGARGCLESYASATAIVRRAKELGLGAEGALTSSSVAKLAEAGDARAQQVFDEAGRALGLSLAHMVNALDLPLYVIGGGAAAAWPLFAPRLFATLRQGSYVYRMAVPRDPLVFETGKTHIAPARLGSEAGLLGAALLPITEARIR